MASFADLAQLLQGICHQPKDKPRAAPAGGRLAYSVPPGDCSVAAARMRAAPSTGSMPLAASAAAADPRPKTGLCLPSWLVLQYAKAVSAKRV